KTDTEGNALAGAQFELYKKYKDGSEKPVDLSVNAEGTVFTAVGIDDGTYILKETKAPDGYNPIEDMEFTVTATHNPLWEGEGRTVILTALSGDKVTGDVATGTLAATIQNKSGTELPTTGGVGTVLLYVLGAALVIGAGVLLVTKFRVSKEQG
ncbi:MAG TPA: SpaA isopeptide-forming pilin-related protein, partial [Clostridiales bacterium]|nr:SpaA isopeptide-forming pilin-related protein [Clostridiales bacterium]